MLMKYSFNGPSVVVIVCGLYLPATGAFGALTVNMNKINEGPRSIGSSVTVISKILDGYSSLTVELFADNRTTEQIPTNRIAFAIYIWDLPATDSPIQTDFPHLHFNTSVGSNFTREIVWYFTNLPSNYDGLILTTKAVGSGSDQASNKTTLHVQACASPLGNAETFNCSMNPCGYECVCNFKCSSGFINDTLNLSTEYGCTAGAEWSRDPPKCVPETTTTEATLSTTRHGPSPDSSTADTPTGTRTPPDVPTHFMSSGPCLAGIGGGLAAIYIGIFVYMAVCSIDIPNKVAFYAMSVLCLLVWGVALGLCFGVSTNEAAVIAGIVIGSFALAGMVVLIGFQISLLKSHKD